jgi:hypothetical protein
MLRGFLHLRHLVREPGNYLLHFHAEGVMHFEANLTIQVKSRVNLVRLQFRLPNTLH